MTSAQRVTMTVFFIGVLLTATAVCGILAVGDLTYNYDVSCEE